MSRGRLRNSSKEPSSARAANVPALAGPTPTSGRRRKLPCCGSSAFSVTTQLCAEGRGCVPLFNPSEGNIFLRPSSRLKSEEKSDHKFLYFLIPRAPPADSLLSGPSQLGTEAVEGPSQDSLPSATNPLLFQLSGFHGDKERCSDNLRQSSFSRYWGRQQGQAQRGTQG